MATSTKLKLFKIQPTKKDEPLYFHDKKLAKRKRDLLVDKIGQPVIIMRGPDHWKGETFGQSEQ